MDKDRRKFVPAMLLDVLVDRDDDLAEKAWRMLCDWGEDVRPALRAGLANPNAIVREQAMHALGHLGDASDLAALRNQALKTSPILTRVASRAIARIKRRVTNNSARRLPRRLIRSGSGGFLD